MRKAYYENEWANALAISLALERTVARYVAARTIVFILTVTAFAFAHDGHSIGFTMGGFGAILFGYLVKKHRDTLAKSYLIKHRLDVLAAYIARFTGDWKNFPEDRQCFQDSKCPPHQDIHIFGAPSIYQYLCVARTRLGRERLAAALSPTPNLTPAEIESRQEAVAELIEHPLLSLELESKIVSLPDNQDSSPLLFELKRSPRELASWLKLLLGLLVFGTISTLGLAIAGAIPLEVPSIFITLNVILTMIFYRRHQSMLESLADMSKELRQYSRIYRTLADAHLASPAMKKILAPLFVPISAIRATHNISTLASLVSLRRNAVFFILANSLFLWDFFCVMYFSHWRRHAGILTESWLDTLAEVEVLLSLAMVGHTRKTYSFPKFSDSSTPEFHMRGGTTLLLADDVATPNDADFTAGTIIITGSNMAGKTTYMRTIGANAVLAYSGAPVCAEHLTLTPMALFTSLQINDNLSQGVSTFYAELLRIKRIMRFSRKGEKMLILIDEIFKGTNYTDRLIGATEAIKQLSLPHAITIVSTHDSELSELEINHVPVTNLHFEEHYVGDEIRFDFKCKPGVCTTTNAQHLLRLAGVIGDTEDDPDAPEQEELDFTS